MNKLPVICIGCGAPLHGPVCEFCDREYDLDEKTAIQGDILDDPEVTVMFHGHEIKCYVADIKIEPLYRDYGVNMAGEMVRICADKPIITFSLISY